LQKQESSRLTFHDKHVCRHPCFNNYDFYSAIIHLPVAAESNITFRENLRTGLYLQDYCVEGSNTLLSAKEAIDCFGKVRKSLPNLSVVAIAGPKEALADFDTVKQVFLGIRQLHPEMILCLSTNGLMLPVYANHLISIGVNSICVTMHTLHPETGAQIYDHITYMGHHYAGAEGANILLQNQMAGISYLTSLGMAVRINIPVMKDINEDEVEEIIKFAKEYGCKFTNVYNANAREKENGLEAYQSGCLSEKRSEYEAIMPQSYFCKPCNAATVETLNTRFSFELSKLKEIEPPKLNKGKKSLRFAVCSQNGTLIDQHFATTTRLYIYEYVDDTVTFLEVRSVAFYSYSEKEDKHVEKLYRLIKIIEDCNCVICMRMGACPISALKEKRIDTYITYNLIEDGIKEAVCRLYEGRRFL